MHELTDQELNQALAYTQSIDEVAGRKIFEQFQLDQTVLAETLFDSLPSVIAKENQAMSYLFMDLCFDVLCVYQQAFGPLPAQHNQDYDWLEKQALLFDVELQTLIQDKAIDARIRSKLLDRLLQNAMAETVQIGLIHYMNAAIDEFASENASRVPAIKTTQAIIFIVIRLFSNLYSHVNQYD